jgi:prepilin-type N-terminal cleavage/methylation domain-containing protein
MKKAFTIVELLVAMALLAMLMAISSMVFAAAVKAYRTAGAATEIAAKLQVMTQQLDSDFHGLRKDGEFLLVWTPWPELEKNNPIPTIVDKNGDGIPDRYVSFDRILFFADGDFQSYDAQPADTDNNGTVDSTTMVFSNLARICYIFGIDEQNKRAADVPNPARHMLCRTQHLISGDTTLPKFPNITGWNATVFGQNNFLYEYQTMIMIDWFNLAFPIKADMLTVIMDMTFQPSSETPNGPKIILNDSATLHQLFMQNIGQFHVQIWRTDLTPNRWYPEIDPDGNGNYGDSDYYVSGGKIEVNNLGGIRNINDDASHFTIYYVDPSIPLPLTIPFASALKFTFTLYDSNGVFKDGKTFTHIVYLND